MKISYYKKTYYKIIVFVVALLIIWKIYYTVNTYNDKYSHTLLYPKIKPLDTYYIKVSDIHTVSFSTYGNKYGKPILVVHGGPGSAPSEDAPRFFDPNYYFIVIVDQRGCGKSKPSGELRENTTQNLIKDFETVREKLNINKWILFGGSWGSTLSLAYTIKHPDIISGMILRGIFLPTHKLIESIWAPDSVISQFNPTAWDYFVNTLPTNSLTGSYIVDYNSCFNGKFGDKKRDECLLSWTVYQKGSSTLKFKDLKEEIDIVKKTNFVEASLIENHYMMNDCFLEPGFFSKIENINIPTIIVQGRYDLVCPPISAHILRKMLPNSQLHTTLAGHSQYDDENINKLVEATKTFQTLKI
jgi:proline iminopeptidase